ncbi:MAG: hypothetical protein WAV09_03325 [Minisyncoccia bacterium]
MRLVLAAVLLGLGAAGIVWGQDWRDAGTAPLREELIAQRKETREELAAQRKENAEVHKKQALEREQDRAEAAIVKMQSAETMLNMRLVVERLNMKPIILVDQHDGGK